MNRPRDFEILAPSDDMRVRDRAQLCKTTQTCEYPIHPGGQVARAVSTAKLADTIQKVWGQLDNFLLYYIIGCDKIGR